MQQAYTVFLGLGLATLRNNATGGDRDALRALAEVLHNIPSLLTSTKRGRHEYFLRAEVAAFRGSVERMPAGIFKNDCENFLIPRLTELEAAIAASLCRPEAPRESPRPHGQ